MPRYDRCDVFVRNPDLPEGGFWKRCLTVDEVDETRRSVRGLNAMGGRFGLEVRTHDECPRCEAVPDDSCP